MEINRTIALTSLLIMWVWVANVFAQDKPALAIVSPTQGNIQSAQGKHPNPNTSEQQFQSSIEKISARDDLLIATFKQTSSGWSCDEVIIQDELNQEFLTAAQDNFAAVGISGILDAAFNWRLLTLRKAGKLKVTTTRRAKRSQTQVDALAEVAMRSVIDKTKHSTDRIMVDPELRNQFDAAVHALDADASLYEARKAAFRLRKTRRLQPELISRVADWGRKVQVFHIEDLRENIKLIDPHPGVYVFRDQTGYLYIGQAKDLRARLADHFDQSHNVALASYLRSAKSATIELHSFDPKSRAKEVRVRRAYESELIRSRKPKFNVLP